MMKKILILASVLITAIMCVSKLSAEESRGIKLDEVTNDKPSFYVRVSVNHEDMTYCEGDIIVTKVISENDGYLYLLYQDATNNVTLLYPNKYHPNNEIKGNQTIMIPETGSNFRLRVAAPFGEEKLLAIVSKEPLNEIKTKDLGNEFTIMDNFLWNRFIKGVVTEGTADTTDKYSNKKWAECCLTIKTIAKNQRRSTEGEKRFFVGIGIGKYEDTNIQEIAVCAKDVEYMKDIYLKKCQVPMKNALTLTNENATLENIQKVFCEALPKNTKPGDTIFVYWSGHGGRCADNDGDEKDGKDEFLVPYDGRRYDRNTMLIDDVFGRWVQNLDGRKMLFIFDACNSGGIATRSKDLDEEPFDFGFSEITRVKDIGQRNVAVIASSAPNESSLVRRENDMSVMTYYIMDSLQTKSGMTQTNLFDAIKDQVHNYVKSNYSMPQEMVIQDDLEQPLIINP